MLSRHKRSTTIPVQNPIIQAEAVAKRFCLKHRFAARLGLRTLAHEVVFFRRPKPSKPLHPREFWALKDISFAIRQGEALAIVGQNGCGKTTLSRVLAGIYKPDAGKVQVNGRVTALFAKGAGFANSLSGYENIFVNMALLGARESEIRRKLDAVIAFADLPAGALDAPVRTYSSGMRARLGFACGVHVENELMIVDEALAVGDLQFRQKCYQRLGELRRQGMSFVVVSHNLKGLMQICDRALYMREGRVVADGPATQVIEKYRTDSEMELQQGALPISASQAFSEHARIRAIYFEDVKGTRLQEVESGKPAGIVLEIETKERVEALNVVIIVKDEQGELGNVVLLDSALAGQTWDLPANSRAEVRAFLPEVRLTSGDYVLKTFLAAGSHHNMIDAIERFPMRVRGIPTEALFQQSATVLAVKTRGATL
jgi:lipopolysaccharide transport system ATP-binding protein